MSVLDDLIKKASESREQSAAQANPFLNGYKANEQKVWSDRHGNVNITDLGTGVTRRHYDSGTLEDVFGLRSVNPNKASPTKDSYLQDTAQALADHLHAQRASYKSALGSAARGIAGLVHGDNNYQPEVGSWLWRMQEGYEAEKGVSAKLGEDSKYGKGWLHGLAMDLTGGAVDLAGDRVLDLVLPGAGLVAMDIRSFGDSAGQSQVQGKSISTQMLNGAIHAAIGHFAEKAGTTVGRGKGTPAWGERLSSAIEGRLEQKGASKLVQKLIMGFGEEAAEEMLEDVLNPAVSKFVAGIDKGDYDAEEFPSLAEIAYDGLVGGLLGLMGGATEGIAATRAAKNGTTEVDVPVRENGESNTSFASRVKDYIETKANEHVDTALEMAAEAKRNSEAASLPAPQTLAEAQQQSPPTETAPYPQSPVKQETGEFNAQQGEAIHDDAAEPRDVDYDDAVAFIDRTGKAILWDEREQNHDQLIGENNWSDRYGLRQAIRDGYIRVKPGNGIELSAENGVLSAEQEAGLKKLINNFKGKTFYVDLDVDLEDGSLYPKYSTSFTGADIDFRTITNWIDKNIRSYERSVSEFEASKTAETPQAEVGQKPKPIGPKTAEKIAGAKFLADAAAQRANREKTEGVEVDAPDFASEASTGPEENVTTKPEAKPESGAEILTETKAEKAKKAPQKTDSKERKALIDRVRKRISEYESELSATKDKGNEAELKRLIEKDKQLLSRLENGEEAAPDSDAYKDEPTSDADSVKQSVLKKLKKDYSTVRNKLTESARKLKNGSARKYSQPELDNLDIPISKRLDAANDYDKAQFMDAVDDYVNWWMKHDEIIDGQHMTEEEKLRLLPAKLERFIKNYDEEHNYDWTVVGNNIVKVYSTDVTGDVKKEEFELRYSDEQLAENARQTRLKHFLSFDLSTKQIAEIIQPLIKPKLLTQHFSIGADGVQGSPYSMNVSYPQTTDKETGKKTPAVGREYTAELYCTDAGTDTAVRVFKFKGKTEADVAKRAANIIRDFELGIQTGREALMKKTRAQIAKELNKQFDAKAKDGSDVLANRAAPDYTGVYTVGDFTASISKAIKESRGMKYFDGWEVKVYIKKSGVDYVIDLVKTNPNHDVDPLQMAATLIHDSNFDMGGYYHFSALKHKQGMPFEKAWTVTPKNGKSVVIDPDGGIHETPVGATAIDDVNEVIGKQADPEDDVDKPWYKELTDEDIVYSANHPERVTINGTVYDVRIDWTSGSKTNVEYVVTVAGEEDVEAHVGISANRIDWDAEDAVKFAIEHPKIWDSGYREGENWGERSNNGEEQSGDSTGAGAGTAAEEAVGESEPEKQGAQQTSASERANFGGDSENGRSRLWETPRREVESDREKRGSAIVKQAAGDSCDVKIADTGDEVISTLGSCEFKDGKTTAIINGKMPDGDICSDCVFGHEGVHGNWYVRYGDAADNIAANFYASFSKHALTRAQSVQLFKVARQVINNYYPDLSGTPYEKLPDGVRQRVANEIWSHIASGTIISVDAEDAAKNDELQRIARNYLIKHCGFGKNAFAKMRLASEFFTIQQEVIDYGVDSGSASGESASPAEETSAVSPEEKAKSTFGKDYEKVQKSADDFDDIKTRFDDEAFQKSDKSRDKKTRNKLKKFREAFRNAATTGDVETLFSIYEDLQSDSNLANFYNEEIQEDIDNWRKLIDPNLDSYNEGAAPYAAARTMQKMAHKFAKANEYQQTLQKMNETLRGSRNGVLRKIGKSERLTASVARALMRWQVNPDTVFKMIDAFDKGNAGEGYKLAKELQEAHREKYRVLREARAKFDKASELKGYQDFAFGKQTVKDYSGREWDMRSALSVIKAIDTIRSTSGKKLGGTDGFGVMDSKGNVEFIDMKDVDAIKLYESLKSGLSDVAIKYGELATEAFNDVKEPLRAKYKQNNGVDIGMVGDEDARLGDKKGIEKAVYSPLSYVDKNGNVYQFDIAKQETYNNIPRFLRERSDAGGTYILIKPYTEVTGKYFEQVSNYLAYSTFNEKMRGLGKGSSYESGLGNTLADVFGKDMGNWYKSYVEDLSTYHNEDDVEGVNSLLRQGRQQLQQGALLGSVSVPMKQISSYWAASGILHPDSLIKNYRVKLFKPKNSSDAAIMLASRAMGNLEQSAAEAAKDAEKWIGKLKYSSKFVKLMANAINQMDYNTVSNLLSATEYDVLKYQFNNDKSKVGTEEYKAAVEELFQEVVDRSQPNFDKQMRAEYGRTDNEIVRMLSMFRTQQTQNLNLLATAIGEYQASKGTANQAKATETLKQTIVGQAASAFSLSMLTILADMLLHRQKKYEDEETEELDMSKILTRLGINAIEASSGTMWFGDTIAKWAIDRISGGKTKEFYGVNMGVISTVSDILENFENFMQNPSRSNAKYCAGNIATLMGIPLNNAYAMLNSAIMYGKDVLGSNEGDYDDILKYLDAQAKAAKKEEEKAAKAAAKAAEKSGADMLADASKQNSSQSELNSAEEQKAPEVSTYLKKPYNALVEAGMTPERSQYVLSFMDTDNNDSIKQSEMWAFYKDNPDYEDYVIAMWNSYGYKTTWEAYKAKHK